MELKRAIGPERVLELLLNIAEWGPEIHGITRAAEVYFEKSPAELTAREAAFLAALLDAPYARHRSWFEAGKVDAARLTTVLTAMASADALTAEEFEDAQAETFYWER